MHIFNKMVRLTGIFILTTILGLTVTYGQYGLNYSSSMREIIERHQFVKKSSIDSLQIIIADSNVIYFPFFYNLYGREVQQANYFGELYLTDSVVVFKYEMKKSHAILPDLKPFIIKINSIKEYELFEESNGLGIRTSDGLEYFFLANSKKPFYIQLKSTFERAQLKRKEPKSKKKKKKK
jgi:hypothetical protein